MIQLFKSDRVEQVKRRRILVTGHGVRYFLDRTCAYDSGGHGVYESFYEAHEKNDRICVGI